jgi:hypothetical protein
MKRKKRSSSSSEEILLKDAVCQARPCHCGSIPKKADAIAALSDYREHPKCVVCGKRIQIQVDLEHDEVGWKVSDNGNTPEIDGSLRIFAESSMGNPSEEGWGHYKCLEKALPYIELPDEDGR